MGRQLLLRLHLTALRQLLQAPLEIGIPAGIALHAEPGSFLHQQLGLAGAHMEDAVAAVIGLLLVLVGKKNRINHLSGVRAVSSGPAAVIGAVLFVHIPVEPMLLGHVFRLGDVLGKCGIRPPVGADQLVIAVTDSDFRHSRLQESGLAVHRAGNGIIVFVKKKMVVVGHLCKVTVLAGREMSVGQGAHLRLVIALKRLPPGEALALYLPVVQVIHDPPDIPVQFIQSVIDTLLQFLQQVGFQPLDTLFDGGLSLGLPGGRRQDHRLIELLQILICGIEDQLISGMLRNGGTEVVGHQILGNRTIVVQGMDGSGDEAGQLLVEEGLGVDHAADANGSDEDMHLPDFAGLGVHQKLRLVTDPVDVHPLSRDPLHCHAKALGPVVSADILVEIMAELGVLVAGGMLLFVPEPQEVEVCLAALPVDTGVDGLIVRHDVLRLPADIGGRVEGCFDFLSRHLLQNLQWDALFQVSGHDEIHGAVANTEAVAAIVIGDALKTHLDDAKNGRAVLH